MGVIDRRELGNKLRATRTAKHLTIKQVVEKLAKADVVISETTITQWEGGNRAPKPQDLKPVLDVLEVDDEERAAFNTLAMQARERTWYSASAATHRASFGRRVGLEGEAVRMHEYSATVLPGLLQTRDYASAIMDAAVPRLSDATIASRVDLRMQRQKLVLEGDGSKLERLHAVLDEGCVRRQVGGETVWREQIEHLMQLSARRDIIVQILPSVVGAHAGMMGGFTLLDFANQRPVVHVELAITDVYEEGEAEQVYRDRFIELREQALPQPLSLRFLQDLTSGRSEDARR